MASYPYQDPELSIPQRVSDLLGRMTLSEKIAQMYSCWLILSADGNHRIRTDPFCQTATTDDIKERLRLGIGEITRPLGTHPVEWGFDGLVVADYAGVSLLHSHHALAKDKAEAAALAFNAGLDVELPGFECAEHLPEAVENRQISEQKINEIVARVLAEKFRLGLFENPYADENRVALQSDSAKEVAWEVPLQSIVLLDNRGILPLDASKGLKLAVIGPTADDQLAMFSGYSFPVHLIVANMQEERVQYAKAPLQALRERFGGQQCAVRQGLRYSCRTQAGGAGIPGRC